MIVLVVCRFTHRKMGGWQSWSGHKHQDKNAIPQSGREPWSSRPKSNTIMTQLSRQMLCTFYRPRHDARINFGLPYILLPPDVPPLGTNFRSGRNFFFNLLLFRKGSLYFNCTYLSNKYIITTLHYRPRSQRIQTCEFRRHPTEYSAELRQYS